MEVHMGMMKEREVKERCKKGGMEELYCIVNRHLYSDYQSINQTEANRDRKDGRWRGNKIIEHMNTKNMSNGESKD